MTPFDYLSVLISIVLGLSITQLLGGFAAMVRARERTAFYWPLPVQMFALFLINIQVWWALFGLRWIQNWTFAGFFVILLQPVTLYLMSAFITPDPVPDGERLDQRAFYFREKNWFFGATLATLLVSLTKDFFVMRGPVGPYDLAAHGVFIAMTLTGLLSNRDIVQKTLAPVTLLLYCAYIALLFVALPG
ncbi:MAG TPA: hypothetical protein VL971_10850 [Rhizomicrobium sp.]|nr:hypothetical protein [Rhizomicrobium sp.]